MHTILSLDLNKEVSSTKRQHMYNELEKLEWKKFPAVTTLWSCAWKEGSTADQCISSVKNEVAKAATIAGVVKYDATVIVTSSKPIADTWKV